MKQIFDRIDTLPDWLFMSFVFALVVLVFALVICDTRKRMRRQQALDAECVACRQDRVIELPPTNPSHDPESTATYVIAPETQDGMPVVMTIPEAVEAGALDKPCPAIQEAKKRLADLPPVVAVVAVTKQPRQYDVDRAKKAKIRVQQAAEFIRRGATPACAAGQYGYSSADSLRKSLNNHGYWLNGQPKEAKQDAAV